MNLVPYEHSKIIIPKGKEEVSVLGRINVKRDSYFREHGNYPKKIFISIELVEELLIEMLPARWDKNAKIAKVPGAKNEICGMEAFRVIEPGIIEVSA